MAMKFGTAPFYRLLKDAYDRGDMSQVMELLYPEIMIVARQKLALSCFAGLNREDREDACSIAVLEMTFEKIGGFLENPRNDPDMPDAYPQISQLSWLHKAVRSIITDAVLEIKVGKKMVFRKDKKKVIPVIISTDQPTGKDDLTWGDRLADKRLTAEAHLLLRERIAEVLAALFKMENTPERLAAVGFVILSENLTDVHRGYDEYAALLNGCRVGVVLDHMALLLRRWDIDDSVLDPVRSRGNDCVIEGLTGKKLANRKNSILKSLKNEFDWIDGGS